MKIIVYKCDIFAQGLIRSTMYTFFFRSFSPKKFEIMRAWSGAIWGWVADWKVSPPPPHCANAGRVDMYQEETFLAWG
jgi:hypothetical protein